MYRIGIIPFEVNDNAIAMLFVTSQTRGRWILPKGKRKVGESHAETCLRWKDLKRPVSAVSSLRIFPVRS